MSESFSADNILVIPTAKRDFVGFCRIFSRRSLEKVGSNPCLATGLDASLSFLSRRCSWNLSPRLLPVSPM